MGLFIHRHFIQYFLIILYHLPPPFFCNFSYLYVNFQLIFFILWRNFLYYFKTFENFLYNFHFLCTFLLVVGIFTWFKINYFQKNLNLKFDFNFLNLLNNLHTVCLFDIAIIILCLNHYWLDFLFIQQFQNFKSPYHLPFRNI